MPSIQKHGFVFALKPTFVKNALYTAEVSKLQPVNQIQPAAVFVNKLFWGHSHTSCGCFHATTELSSLDRDLKYERSDLLQESLVNQSSVAWELVSLIFGPLALPLDQL